jgi:hypothetical protein
MFSIQYIYIDTILYIYVSVCVLCLDIYIHISMYTHIISDGPKPIWAWNCAFPSEFTGHTRYLALEGTRAVADCDQVVFLGVYPLVN